MSVFKCKICGGTLELNDGCSVAVCEYCGTKQTVPKLDSEQKINLYDRADHFRRNNDYDKAMSIYESILNADKTDAEAYWSILLCRYGVEYVEDPQTHKHIPTINRAQFASVLADEDYKSAIKYADASQREIYEAEAEYIDNVQKDILAISQKEEPFDVFICYKETDQNGRRTQDSVLATDLYHGLANDGFKVFFSRITLEDKLGTAYEPYIFAALNSAKVMVVIGTKPEYFDAVWVKNEWSRYLALIKSGAKKTLIPAYRDMDPYDLPEEFSHLQALDMSKLGFMQDLIHGIKEIIGSAKQKAAEKPSGADSGNENTNPLLKRAFIYLEDENWDSAVAYCERVLDSNPESAEAYLGKLMAELQVRKQGDLKECVEPFDENGNYQKAYRYGNDKLKSELQGYIDFINNRNEQERLNIIYNDAVRQIGSATSENEFKFAAETFASLLGYKDSDEKHRECIDKAEIARKNTLYDTALDKQSKDTVPSLVRAIEMFSEISGWMDADEQICNCRKRMEEIKLEEEQDRLEKERKAEAHRIAAEKAKKKTKKIVKIAIPSVIAIVAFVVLLTQVIIPSSKYSKGVSLRENGDFDEAINVFSSLGDYKDAVDQIPITYYANGKKLVAEKNFDGAVDAFRLAGHYNDAPEQVLATYYAKGKSLAESKNFEEAISAFTSAGNYEDALEQVSEMRYLQ